ncbi:MAG: hypothetical protein AAGG47_21375 [Pseudomonadota bacterium]
MIAATIEAADVSRAAAACARIVKRSTIPLLECIRMRAEDGVLAMDATSLGLHLTMEIKADVRPADGFAVPADVLRKFAGSAPSGSQIEIRQKERRVDLKAGRNRADLPTLPSSDFPMRPNAYAKIETEEVDPKTFCEALNGTLPAAEKGTVKEYLRGVFVDGSAVVATDGNSMHVFELALRCAPSTLPSEHVPHIVDALKDGGRFGSDGEAWRVDAPGRMLAGQCLGVPYPDWTRVQAKAGPAALFDREEMLAAAKAVDLFRTKTRVVVLRCSAADGTLQVGLEEADSGQTSSLIQADAKHDFAVGVSLPYLLNALSMMPEGAIEICAEEGDTIAPIMLRPQQSEAFTRRRATIMPLRR